MRLGEVGRIDADGNRKEEYEVEKVGESNYKRMKGRTTVVMKM